VLLVEFGHLVAGEVAQGERLHLDVEGTGGAQVVSSVGGHLVVAHVPQAAQDHRGGKALGPPGEAGAKLAQHAQQALAAQGIDFVEEEHQGARAGASPGREVSLQQGFIPFELQCRWLQLRREVRLGAELQLAQDGPLSGAIVVPRHFALLAREVEGCVAAGRGELLGKGAEHRRLSRLPGSVEDEVAILLNEPLHLREAA
jgi:hypothetical protein